MTRQTTTLTLAAAIGTTYADAVITYDDDQPDELVIEIPDRNTQLVLHRTDIPAPYALETYGDEDGDGFMATYDMIVPQDGE